ncbi:hypothetical protein CYK80_04095 [Clostridium perfringens]|uniref:Phage protein n=1 Tax=Clostridium perfringens TaxID=1502 RepID=A0AB37C1E4_CLOPF|nr:hypothetical protein [Clostridium perfringens]ASY51654.1 hypothetical protein BG908_08285 [Clostridium perfringens]AWS26168.1 hypothetical protein CYK96_11265 [Clostridium perfringens]MDH2459548.1 hypothetical protein [Clostridium perfringens]MDU2470838.1 hypothetical protein [Clostridium perfringens]PWX36729.1 hypothetical protein CYK91_15080 [Clostridium perfringens]
MKDMLDKNGNELKGSARWLRQISIDGGLEKHDKKVAMEAFEDFLDSRPNVSRAIAEDEAKKRRKLLKLVK